ncbi:MAG TPA: ParB N-terminal domain-containing protein [Vicinamibacterales bacterium]|nr:ParB N-terminal domain-containing protein [Vicinamibacterales bacterium]
MAEFDSPSEELRPSREGLPSSYRMRAEPHYVDLLASRGLPGRERSLPISALGKPDVVDVAGLEPLIESVRQDGVLQPLLVNERGGTMQVISGHRRLAAAGAAGLREVPCLVHDVDEDTAERMRAAANLAKTAVAPAAQVPAVADPTDQAGEPLSRALSTVSSLADLLTGDISDLSRGVVGTLLKAELFRTSTLVQSSRVVRGELAAVRGAVPVASLIDRVVQGFAAERRMRHVEFVPHVDLPPAHIVIADERLLSAALTGAVVATLALVEGMPASRISVVAGLTATRQLTLVVSQDHVLPGSVWAERAFDAGWRDRAGGAPVVLGMLALQRAARVHGGEAAATLSPRGSRIAITIPAGA